MKRDETPSPAGLRLSQLTPIPESVRRTRECNTQTRLTVERILESARKIRANEPVPDTQRSPVWGDDVPTERKV